MCLNNSIFDVCVVAVKLSHDVFESRDDRIVNFVIEHGDLITNHTCHIPSVVVDVACDTINSIDRDIWDVYCSELRNNKVRYELLVMFNSDSVQTSCCSWIVSLCTPDDEGETSQELFHLS